MKRKNLKIARIKKEMSQKELAKKIGVSTQAISDFERGIINPSYETMKKISEALESSVDDIFFEK
ncbi:putative transcriptional regulator [Acetoanaerobium pronyense]|uniref:Transcriptional regulator n=1 Tax=Acetoanaerobium pronyense TaxID=1482736 RepID=A0ABS4KI36_9FIRM|nr:helix-turn-helix transcriptional regulator [Acetoanaerobium pronyense]MBP2027449.1 putative transcriptional regulator [Acetoanaerobium pronyense]